MMEDDDKGEEDDRHTWAKREVLEGLGTASDERKDLELDAIRELATYPRHNVSDW